MASEGGSPDLAHDEGSPVSTSTESGLLFGPLTPASTRGPTIGSSSAPMTPVNHNVGQLGDLPDGCLFEHDTNGSTYFRDVLIESRTDPTARAYIPSHEYPDETSVAQGANEQSVCAVPTTQQSPENDPPVPQTPPLQQESGPRLDRLSQPVTAQNAQGHFPPVACVFLANLPQKYDDEALSTAVHKLMSPYGECYVKLRRHKVTNNPHAFVQFTDESHARQAIEDAAGKDVLGRPVRLEVSRAHRDIYLIRRDGQKVTREEALELLTNAGPIAEIRDPNPEEGSDLFWLNGIYVKFVYFDDKEDAQKMLRDHKTYQTFPLCHVRSFRNMDFATEAPKLVRQTRSTYGNELLMKWIYVTNIPRTITEGEIRRSFGTFGDVLCVHKHDQHLTYDKSYAFVRYRDELEAAKAVLTSGCIGWGGSWTKVTFRKRPNTVLRVWPVTSIRPAYMQYGSFNGGAVSQPVTPTSSTGYMQHGSFSGGGVTQPVTPASPTGYHGFGNFNGGAALPQLSMSSMSVAPAHRMVGHPVYPSSHVTGTFHPMTASVSPCASGANFFPHMATNLNAYHRAFFPVSNQGYRG